MSDHHDAQDYRANGPAKFGFRTRSTSIKTGVDVDGTEVGVHGHGGIIGVFGETVSGIAAVQGVALEGYGVIGRSREKRKTTSVSVGVTGESLAKGGTGVQGRGTIGVTGSGTIGVEGIGLGAGGEAGGPPTGGRGGVFSSDTCAQINLVPKLNEPPAEGKEGDLIVAGGRDPTTGTGLPLGLWLCVKANHSNISPAKWRPVQLGNEVQGKG